jgi:hypothetical protein
MIRKGRFDELFFIVAISLLYFGADKVFGRKLLFGFLISTQVNELGKAIFKDPRPVTNGTEAFPFLFAANPTSSMLGHDVRLGVPLGKSTYGP